MRSDFVLRFNLNERWLQLYSFMSLFPLRKSGLLCFGYFPCLSSKKSPCSLCRWTADWKRSFPADSYHCSWEFAPATSHEPPTLLFLHILSSGEFQDLSRKPFLNSAGFCEYRTLFFLDPKGYYVKIGPMQRWKSVLNNRNLTWLSRNPSWSFLAKAFIHPGKMLLEPQETCSGELSNVFRKP